MSQREREELDRAIAALEARRAALGGDLVDQALAPLRARLAALDTPPPAASHRKQVTVLFARVSGIAAVDAEETAGLLDALWRPIDAAVVAHGGRITQHAGDTLMALWGTQPAREDDAASAVRAALEVRSAAQEFAGARRAGLQIHIGLNTGPAAVGMLETTGEYTAVGDTVNVAGRMAQAAPAGGILVAQATYRLVRGAFSLQALPPLAVKGKTEPLATYLVRSALPPASRLTARGVEGVIPPLIGRDLQLRRLVAAFYETRQGAGQAGSVRAVTITGEAGIGKSRLLDAFDHRLDLAPGAPRRFRGCADPHQQARPGALLRSVFAECCEIHDDDSAEVVGEKLERGVAELLGRPGDDARLPAHALGAWLGYDLRASPFLADLAGDPRRLRDRALLSLTELLRAAAEAPGPAPGNDRGAVLFLEDLHWADDPSLDALGEAARQIALQPGASLLIVCTARAEMYERVQAWTARLPGHLRLDLPPLTPAETRVLVAGLLCKAESVPEELVDLVTRRAEGNPFYVEELIRKLVDDGLIHTAREPWQIAPIPFAALGIPETLRGMLQARVDGLGPLERRVLECASVVGRTFWDQAVASIEVVQAGIARPVTEVLERLCGREIVFAHEPAAFAGTREFVFKHALMYEVVYDGVSKRDRREYHSRVALWLAGAAAAAGRVEEYAATIARHYDEAGDAPAARGWYWRTGRRAMAAFANAEAGNYLRRALELTPAEDVEQRFALVGLCEQVYALQGQRSAQAEALSALADLGAAGHPGDAADPAARARRGTAAALRRADYCRAIGDHPGALAAAQEAVRLAQATGDAESAAQGHLRWGQVLLRRCEYDAARDHMETARAIAEASRAVGLQAEILRNLGMTQAARGDRAAARALYEQAMVLYRAAGDRRGESATWNNLGSVMHALGDYAGAQECCRRALDLFRELGDRPGESYMLSNLGAGAYAQGDYDAALAHTQRALDLFRALGNRVGEGNMLYNLGILMRDLGDQAVARTCYEASLRIMRDLGNRSGECESLHGLARLSHDLGDPRAACEFAREAARIAEEIGARSMLGEVLATFGHALARVGESAAAAAAYERAVALDRETGQLHLALEPLAALAQLAAARGDRGQAQAFLDEVLGRLPIETLGDTASLFQVYLTTYRVLQALHPTGDRRAVDLLEIAHRLLQARAGRLSDPALRRSLLENVPVHREIVAEWESSLPRRR